MYILYIDNKLLLNIKILYINNINLLLIKNFAKFLFIYNFLNWRFIIQFKKGR